MIPFNKIVFKTFPNKWKKGNQPDTKGSVECTLPDGTAVVYDYAQWKPREGKSQTMTVWKLKEDRAAAESGEQRDSEAGGDQQPESPPQAPQEAKPAAPNPPAPRIKDDADGW